MAKKGVKLLLLSARKSRRHDALKVIFINRLVQEGNLCPVKCLEHYVSCTNDLWNDVSDSLFIFSKKPHPKATPSTVARWIKSILFEAGVDVPIFSAHSTGAASASAAWAKGMVLEAILKRVGVSFNVFEVIPSLTGWC